MILDGDLSVPPEDLPKFHRGLVDGRAELVNGSRLVYDMEPGAMRFLNMIGNRAFARLLKGIMGQQVKDTLCGTKVLLKRDYERIAAGRSYFGEFDPFGDFDLLFGAARLGLKIVDLPVRYHPRTYGETNISRWRHGVLLLQMTLFAFWKFRVAPLTRRGVLSGAPRGCWARRGRCSRSRRFCRSPRSSSTRSRFESPWWTYADADASYTASALNLCSGDEATVRRPSRPAAHRGVALAFGRRRARWTREPLARRAAALRRRTLLDLDRARWLFRGFAALLYLARRAARVPARRAAVRALDVGSRERPPLARGARA